jgi:hypothetical protein
MFPFEETEIFMRLCMLPSSIDEYISSDNFVRFVDTFDFRKFLKSAGYIKGISISTDGTKIKANASRDILIIDLINREL